MDANVIFEDAWMLMYIFEDASIDANVKVGEERLTREGCPDRGCLLPIALPPSSAPDAASEDTGFSTQPSADQSGKLGHI